MSGPEKAEAPTGQGQGFENAQTIGLHGNCSAAAASIASINALLNGDATPDTRAAAAALEPVVARIDQHQRASATTERNRNHDRSVARAIAEHASAIQRLAREVAS